MKYILSKDHFCGYHQMKSMFVENVILFQVSWDTTIILNCYGHERSDVANQLQCT